MSDQPWLKWIMQLSLVDGPLPWTFWILTMLGVAILLIALIVRRGHKPLGITVIVTVICGVVGWLLSWLLSDVFKVFGVTIGPKVMLAVGEGFAVLGFAIAAFVFMRRFKRVIAALLIPISLLATCLHVDAIYGQYQTIGSIFGYSSYEKLPTEDTGKASTEDTDKALMTVEQWKAKAQAHELGSIPSEGRLYEVSIPNTKSGFNVRNAVVYLPPAALSEHPPALPVMELLCGQPGAPQHFFECSHMQDMLDAYAAEHDGLAPIVISPDQNGSFTNNSLCADTSQGKAETYLTEDVVDWVNDNLPVSSQKWAIGGFSQGGTCSVQLGPRHPNQYMMMIPIDSELQPTNGSVESMIANYFDGDAEAYNAQVPVNAIKAHAPSNQVLFFGAGKLDNDSVNNMRTISQAASEAGMSVTMLQVPNTAHDWHAAEAVLEPALDKFCQLSGLGELTKSLEEYSSVEVLK
ncbi:alpha/beta hydrolase [Bifidobacterium panos]|uniref:Esterase n=1 Tax=Bifidobacterium panos TaxID=2675321 RepID=A0ABX1T095_9BIFI|nr:alpha/beta hydrolase-fold protein [Bifidobacterium sp. DSM 109963]NMN02249.1 esterase [Bifidobacterium sp. DSM 109963]